MRYGVLTAVNVQNVTGRMRSPHADGSVPKYRSKCYLHLQDRNVHKIINYSGSIFSL